MLEHLGGQGWGRKGSWGLWGATAVGIGESGRVLVTHRPGQGARRRGCPRASQ